MSDELNFRIAKLMDERGLKPYPFAKNIGIASSTMTSIYKGKVKFENISISTFLKIAHGLGMTAEQLYYGEDGEVGDSHPLTADEQRVMDAYRLDRRARRTIDHAVSDYMEDVEESAREKKEVI